MSLEAPQWGIETVPERLRVLGLGDTLLLWGNLAVSLLVIVAGALLVPAFSLRQALLAIVVASVVGSSSSAAAALVGTDARVPAMVLMRAPLRAARLVPRNRPERRPVPRVVGVRADHHRERLRRALRPRLRLPRPVALDAPLRRRRRPPRAARADRFVRRYIRKFAVWFVLASLGYLTWWAIDKSDLTAFWHATARGGFRPSGRAST